MTLNKAYINASPDTINLVPANANRLLDVGCYNGELGKALKSLRPHLYVAGVEIDERAAVIAKNFLDEVVVADLENFNFSFGENKFDCIVFLDVLEHLRYPELVLKASLNVLENNGSVIISLPNIQHITAIKNLIIGKWPQRERGLFDKTHLRFFTWRSIEDLAANCDLSIDKISLRFRLIDHPNRVNRYANYFKYTPLKRYFIYQYLVRLHSKQ